MKYIVMYGCVVPINDEAEINFAEYYAEMAETLGINH